MLFYSSVYNSIYRSIYRSVLCCSFWYSIILFIVLLFCISLYLLFCHSFYHSFCFFVSLEFPEINSTERTFCSLHVLQYIIYFGITHFESNIILNIIKQCILIKFLYHISHLVYFQYFHVLLFDARRVQNYIYIYFFINFIAILLPLGRVSSLSGKI